MAQLFLMVIPIFSCKFDFLHILKLFDFTFRLLFILGVSLLFNVVVNAHVFWPLKSHGVLRVPIINSYRRLLVQGSIFLCLLLIVICFNDSKFLKQMTFFISSIMQLVSNKLFETWFGFLDFRNIILNNGYDWVIISKRSWILILT